MGHQKSRFKDIELGRELVKEEGIKKKSIGCCPGNGGKNMGDSRVTQSMAEADTERVFNWNSAPLELPPADVTAVHDLETI